MSATVFRRTIGLLATLPVAFGLLVAQAGPAAADGTGTLFAITGTSQTIVKIDPSTGAFTQVADLNNSNRPQSTALVSDPQDHRLFALRTTLIGFDPTFGFPIFSFEFLNIDSQTGAIVANPTFSGAVPQAFVFDTSSGTLFGLTQTQVVKVTPSTAAITPVANIPNPFGSFIYSMAIDSSSHTIYLGQEDVSGAVGTNFTTLYAINDATGSVRAGVVLDQPIRQIAADGSQLFGITDCCTFNLVAVNVTTGVTTAVANVGNTDTIIQFGTGVDPSTHRIFVNVGTNDPITGAFVSQLLIVNDQSGAEQSLPLADGIAPLGFAFEEPVAITPESIIADVNAAQASGAISNAGVATSLLAELNAASDARARGQCSVAAADYQAFINEVTAQSGKTISTSTADQLIAEAQFLIANCP